MKHTILILISTFFCLLLTQAQEIAPLTKRGNKAGLISGYGGQNEPFVSVNYTHEVIFIQGQYFHSMSSKPHWQWDFVWQPQFNLTRFRFIDLISELEPGYEIGVNMGVMCSYVFSRDVFRPYLMLSVGPHYVSGVPKRQSPGFIFSDNAFLGFMLRLNARMWLDMRPGYRHISNAGLLRRNGGVNNAVLSGGFLVDLDNW